jgi:hypothetical protein
MYKQIRERSAFLTEAEAARLLRLSERTLQRFRQLGCGPPYARLGLRRIVYPRDCVFEWANERRCSDTS